MTGKELVLAAFAGKTVERIPWVPFCGVHSAFLIGKTATEFLRSADLVVAGQTEAARRYRPDGLPVVFDLQIEAEILGCKLNWSDDNPPAVISHPLGDGELKLEDLKIPGPGDGRMPIALEASRRLRAAYPDLALYGLITGPFTLALHLLGADIFMQMFDDPDYVNRVLAFCAEVANKLSSLYLEAGCDIVAVVDPMTSQIGPEQFEEFCSAPCKNIFSHIREAGGKSSFFVCGDARKNIEVMCGCGCDNISIDENIPLDFVRDICVEKGVSFGGNIKLTTVMLLGTPDANKVDAFECMRVGGLRGYLLAPGCDMPYAVPPANVEAIAAVVHDPYQQSVAKELAAKGGVAAELMDLSGYGQGDKVVVDIITLDSEACAPCQYMVESVKNICPEFGDALLWREHKIKNPESIALMASLHVRNIPTICVDGQIKFVSTIPPRDELRQAIYQRLREKFARKLQLQRGSLLLLGSPADSKYQEFKANIVQAMKELGATVDFEEVNDPDAIRALGVVDTPAVLSRKVAVKAAGEPAGKDVVKEWLKSLME